MIKKKGERRFDRLSMDKWISERKKDLVPYKMSLFSLYHICYVHRVYYGTDIYEVYSQSVTS